MVNELCLDILGTSFTITTDEDETYLKKVLNQYQVAIKNTQKISGISEPLNVAILTGFLLCDEINKIKQKQEKESLPDNTTQDDYPAHLSWEEQEVEERTLNLINKLNNVLDVFGDDENI